MRTLPLALLLSLPGIAAAQSADRTETWEAGIKVMDMSHEFIEGQGGSSIDVEGELAWGFFGGYNFNEHFALYGEFAWSDPDYLAEFPIDLVPGTPSNTVVTVDAELDVWFTNFKAVYNFLDRDLTPYVELGYGWTSVDSNIQDGPASTGCWWDPWWGYICTTFQDTKTLDGFTYGVGVGARYDFSDSLALSASYRMGWVDLDKADGTPDMDSFLLNLGWKF